MNTTQKTATSVISLYLQEAFLLLQIRLSADILANALQFIFGEYITQLGRKITLNFS